MSASSGENSSLEIQPKSQAGPGSANMINNGISARSGINEGISIMGFGVPGKQVSTAGQMQTKCIVTLPISAGTVNRDFQSLSHNAPQVSPGLNIATGSQGIQGRPMMSLGNSQILYSQGGAMTTLENSSGNETIMKSNRFLLDNKGSVQPAPSSDAFSSNSQTTGPSSQGVLLSSSSIVPPSGLSGLVVRDRPSGGIIASTALTHTSTSPQSSGSSHTFTDSRTPRIRCISESSGTTEELDTNSKINLECSETGSNLGGSDTCSDQGDEEAMDTGSHISFGSNLDQGSTHTMTGSQSSEASANPPGIRRTKNGILLRDRTNR